MRRQYPFHTIEPKWQEYWLKNKSFRAANPGEPGSEKPKFYVLDMFPYPSGAGLHVGHPEGYTATDIVARYKRMRGFNVLHPMGWDAFGLPAEQYAIKTGTHPRITTEQNINTFRRQIQALGFSYDWDREVDTTDPAYFKWTQWIFLQLYKHGLAYVSEAPVWYCPELGTVLANEEVLNTPEGPRSERGEFPVEKRPLRQWMLKITAYAERLLNDLDTLDWPDSLKEMQRNWIGRSEGAQVDFRVLDLTGKEAKLTVYTTRPDTLFGATYMVMAPEHPLVDKVVSKEQAEAVSAYRKKIAAKSDLERTELSKEKTGVFTGGYAKNPVNGKKIPIWIADYVLMGYGTGAIMAVPAHDERDYEFATAFGLDVIEVVKDTNRSDEPEEKPLCFAGLGTAINSANKEISLDGKPTAQAKMEIIAWLEKKKVGKAQVQYKLRDWLFSRQRYWGEPFPIVWTEKDGKPIHHALTDDVLPITLPELDDYKPSQEGLAPLSKAKDWLQLDAVKVSASSNVKGEVKTKAKPLKLKNTTRETNTMPQWAGSCWYYLRYCDPNNDTAPIGKKAEQYWMGEHGVDLYIGGAEHAVLHLLYARFWHKVLYDIGVVSSPEPFYKLVNQGIILGEDGQKMSKSRGNVINPDDVIQNYGADAFRLFEMFMGPLTQIKPWDMKGVEGVYRFLGRVWRLIMVEDQEGNWVPGEAVVDEAPSVDLQRSLHKTIKKVGDDIESLSFNTAISALMVLTNDLTKLEKRPRQALRTLLLLLAPFAPHLAEELWQILGHDQSLAREPWPAVDEKLLVQDQIPIVIQVNGKLRAKLQVPPDLGKDHLESKARQAAADHLGNKDIVKVIVVPNRLVNFVVKG